MNGGPTSVAYLPLLGLGHSQRCWLTVFCSFLFFSWPKSNPVPSLLSTLPSVPCGPTTHSPEWILAELILWKYWRTKEMSVVLAVVIIWPSPVVYSMANSASAWRIQFFKSFVLFWDSCMFFSIHLIEGETLLHMISIKPKYVFGSGEACLQSEWSYL